MKSYFVYILASNTGTLYVGVTNDLQKRVFEHKNSLVPGFTSKYNIKNLVYYCEFANVEEAINMEKIIKKWNRTKKINLIKTLNPRLKDLSLN